MQDAENLGKVLAQLQRSDNPLAGIRLALSALSDPRSKPESCVWLAMRFFSLNHLPVALHFALMAKPLLMGQVKLKLQKFINAQRLQKKQKITPLDLSSTGASRGAEVAAGASQATYRFRSFHPADAVGAIAFFRANPGPANAPLVGPYVFVCGANAAHDLLHSTGWIFPLPEPCAPKKSTTTFALRQALSCRGLIP